MPDDANKSEGEDSEAREIVLSGPGSFAVTVAGAAQYQNVIAAAGERDAIIDAVLVLEDSNPYDDHAVAVRIAGERAGYLSRADARRYRADLAGAGCPRATVRCRAKIVGGFTRASDRTHYGLRLDLPEFSS